MCRLINNIIKVASEFKVSNFVYTIIYSLKVINSAFLYAKLLPGIYWNNIEIMNLVKNSC